MGFGEGCPHQVAFGAEPFEIDAVVFAGFFAVAKAGFDVDAQGRVGDTSCGEHSAVGVGGRFDDERSLDNFYHMVKRVVYALDEGAANVGVNAAGKEKEQNGGDGGIPESEAAAGGLKHCRA